MEFFEFLKNHWLHFIKYSRIKEPSVLVLSKISISRLIIFLHPLNLFIFCVARKYFKLILSLFYPTSIMYLRFSLYLGMLLVLKLVKKKAICQKHYIIHRYAFPYFAMHVVMMDYYLWFKL